MSCVKFNSRRESRSARKFGNFDFETALSERRAALARYGESRSFLPLSRKGPVGRSPRPDAMARLRQRNCDSIAAWHPRSHTAKIPGNFYARKNEKKGKRYSHDHVPLALFGAPIRASEGIPEHVSVCGNAPRCCYRVAETEFLVLINSGPSASALISIRDA